MHMGGKVHDLLRLTVTSHETYAGDFIGINGKQGVKHTFIKFKSDVLLQVRAVAPGTPVGTLGEIQSQRHLTGHFLEHYII